MLICYAIPSPDKISYMCAIYKLIMYNSIRKYYDMYTSTWIISICLVYNSTIMSLPNQEHSYKKYNNNNNNEGNNNIMGTCVVNHYSRNNVYYIEEYYNKLNLIVLVDDELIVIPGWIKSEKGDSMRIIYLNPHRFWLN